MKYGYLKVAAASPDIRVADCDFNATGIIAQMKTAYTGGVRLIVFPELSVCGYTCGDLFFQQTLIEGCEKALGRIIRETAEFDIASCIGVPVRHNDALYNCAAVICSGKLLGLVPKSFPPNYSEFYELRHFAPAPKLNDTCSYAGFMVPFGTKQLFHIPQMPNFSLAVELCEDLWVPLPPSVGHVLAGATVIANLSASNEIIGKAEYRRSLVSGQSGRLICGYIYASAGFGESTSDVVFAAHNVIAENGVILAEAEPFGTGLAVSEIDVSLLAQERCHLTSFRHPTVDGYITTPLDIDMIETMLTRRYSRHPFVPENNADKAQRCELILSMQANGLAKRLSHIKAKTAVVGISGGLDSCLALLVAVRAMELLCRPAADVLAVTMPCFGTTSRTRSNAEKLVNCLGASFSCIDIRETTLSHFRDIGQSPENSDVVFENGQARGRTYVLMDLANKTGGIVVGTGDLSELALGWATYNGDHMSMYGVNASVPKTLVRHIISYYADTAENPELDAVLRDILATPVSPELLPADEDNMTQLTEDIIGPYELHDFILYYAIRRSFTPSKIFKLLVASFDGDYDRETLKKWLANFYNRFFSQQFKRSCLPDGPKVGSVALSPRGDWRMPSDAVVALWHEEIEKL